MIIQAESDDHLEHVQGLFTEYAASLSCSLSTTPRRIALITSSPTGGSR